MQKSLSCKHNAQKLQVSLEDVVSKLDHKSTDRLCDAAELKIVLVGGGQLQGGELSNNFSYLRSCL